MHPFLPNELRGIRTAFGRSMVLESENKPIVNHGGQCERITACEFRTGPITPEIARIAEAFSETYARKRRAK